MTVYDRAHLYDLAFSYRDFAAEVEALCKMRAKATSAPLKSALELAAGPADHARELAGRGVRAVALDLAPAMCELAKEKARREGRTIELLCADMTAFTLSAPVDLALTMIDSISHLHTLDALVAHLRCVRDALTEGGVYIMEIAHPSDFVGRSARTTGVSEPWTVVADGMRLTTQWGRADDPYDPIAQVFDAHVSMRGVGPAGPIELDDVVRMRDWTATEISAAVALAGGLSVVATYGDFDLDVPVDHPEAWRMITVLARG